MQRFKENISPDSHSFVSELTARQKVADSLHGNAQDKNQSAPCQTKQGHEGERKRRDRLSDGVPHPVLEMRMRMDEIDRKHIGRNGGKQSGDKYRTAGTRNHEEKADGERKHQRGVSHCIDEERLVRIHKVLYYGNCHHGKEKAHGEDGTTGTAQTWKGCEPADVSTHQKEVDEEHKLLGIYEHLSEGVLKTQHKTYGKQDAIGAAVNPRNHARKEGRNGHEGDIGGDEPIAVGGNGEEESYGLLQGEGLKSGSDHEQIHDKAVKDGLHPHTEDTFQAEFGGVGKKIACDEDKAVYADEREQFCSFQNAPKGCIQKTVDRNSKSRAIKTVDVQPIGEEMVHHNTEHTQHAQEFELRKARGGRLRLGGHGKNVEK